MTRSKNYREYLLYDIFNLQVDEPSVVSYASWKNYVTRDKILQFVLHGYNVKFYI